MPAVQKKVEMEEDKQLFSAPIEPRLLPRDLPCNIPQQLVYVPAQTDEKEAWDILKNMYVDDG